MNSSLRLFLKIGEFSMRQKVECSADIWRMVTSFISVTELKRFGGKDIPLELVFPSFLEMTSLLSSSCCFGDFLQISPQNL